MTLQELEDRLDGLPTGDPEGDHAIIDQTIVDFLVDLSRLDLPEMHRFEGDIEFSEVSSKATKILNVWGSILVKWYA